MKPQLSLVPQKAPSPDTEVVELLERLLAAAKDGQISSLFVFYDGPKESGMEITTYTDVRRLVFELEAFKWRLMADISESNGG